MKNVNRTVVQQTFSCLKKSLCIIIVVLCSHNCSFGQDDLPLPEESSDDPVGVPFDGGAASLVAAGVVYGIKHWGDAKRKDKKTEETTA